MLRASASSICRRCEVSSLFSSTLPTVTPPSWQQLRFAGGKRTPSRMTLSKRVGQSNSKTRSAKHSKPTAPTTRTSWGSPPVQPKGKPSSFQDDPFGRPDRPKNDSKFSQPPRDRRPSFQDNDPFGRPDRPKNDSKFSQPPRDRRPSFQDNDHFGRPDRPKNDSKFSQPPRDRRPDNDSFGKFDRPRNDSKFSQPPRDRRPDNNSFGKFDRPRNDSKFSQPPRDRRPDNDSFGKFDRPRNDSKFSQPPRDRRPDNNSFGKFDRPRNDSKFSQPPRDRRPDNNSFGKFDRPRNDSKFSQPPRDRRPDNDSFGKFDRPRNDSKFSQAPRSNPFSFRENDSFSKFDRPRADSKSSQAQRDSNSKLRDMNISAARRAALYPRKPQDLKFSRGPRKDDAARKPFWRDDDSPSHLNRTEAPKDLVPPRQTSRNRRDNEKSFKDAPSISHGRPKFGPRPHSDWRKDPSLNRVLESNSKGKEHFHALKMQMALEPVSYKLRTSVKGKIAELDDFLYFDLLHELQESIRTQALPGLTTVEPTPAQRVAIPALLGMDREKSSEMEQFLLAAETGSGKTLAYMVPIIDAMKRAELAEKEIAKAKEQENQKKKSLQMFELEPPPLSGEENPNAGRPRVLILVPSAELVQQVGAVAKAFSHTVKFRAALVSAALSPIRIRNTLFAPNGVDMVISTPHLLASIGESDPNIFSRVTHLVVDEADSLLDRSFSPLTTRIIDKSTPSLKQLIFCSATIPNSMDGYLRKHFPNTIRLVTPNIHAIPRRVQMAVVNVSQDPYRGNKELACAETIHQIAKSKVEHWYEEREVSPTKRIIVFVNEREKAVEVAEYLNQKGFNATALNRDTTMERQAHILAEFGSTLFVDKRETKKKSDEEKAALLPEKPTKFPNTKVLVSTDLGSRGIDTTAVRHVILYDVPHTTIDFIHRIGRTGRMGRRGRAIVLLGRGDRADVVKEVRETMFKGQALI